MIMKIFLTDTAGVEDEAVGEINIQVDIFTNPGTGEQKVTVKGKTNLSQVYF